MIKFFRKIRYNLMEQNKTGKYFKYAIGEIVLVVIGILIALSINNWNEERKTRKTEFQVLKRLNDEFISNKLRFDSHHEYKNKTDARWKQFIEELADTSQLNDAHKHGRPTNGGRNFNIVNSALNSFLNTGKIENISNDSLKYLLSNWGNEISVYKDVENKHSNFVENTLRGYEQSRRITEGNVASNYKNPFFKIQKKEKIEEIRAKLYADIEYQNLLFTNSMWLSVTSIRGAELHKKFIKILQLLDEEIEKKKN